MIKPEITLACGFGDRQRTVVAGMKRERKQALFVVNLEPRRMRGVVSDGMLFDIGYADGIRPDLAAPEAPAPDGTTLLVRSASDSVG